MSILIKGMEMPQNCYTCNLCNYYNEPNQGCYCVTLRADLHSTGIMKERAKNCPLVELPPHGRLIDADAIPYKKIMLDEDDDEFYYGVTQPYIDRMPTIIEAEGRE